MGTFKFRVDDGFQMVNAEFRRDQVDFGDPIRWFDGDDSLK